MQIVLLILILAWNFFISCSNAKNVGRVWTESKEVGGSFRVLVVSGYIMAIAGFTMVYGYILLLIAPYVLPFFVKTLTTEDLVYLEELAANLIYLLTVMAVIPTGFVIWFKSLKNFFENKTISNGLNAGYNTWAMAHNTINAAKNVPSTFEKVVEACIGGKKKEKNVLTGLAILLVICAVFGGYFTASAIMKKADLEYDMLSDMRRRGKIAY